MKNRILNLIGLLVVGVLMAPTTYAQVAAPSNFGLVDWSGGGGIPGLIANIVKVILGIAGTVAVLFIIIGGFQYILSGANEDLAKRGRTTVVNAVIGLIIIILSYTVIAVVSKTLLGLP
jgi:hypothetical protein